MLLKSYYDLETVRRALTEVVSREKALDALNCRMRELTASVELDGKFVAEGRIMRDGLIRRNGLESKVKLLHGDHERLMAVLTEWPGADSVLQSKRGELGTLGKSLEAIEVELSQPTVTAELPRDIDPALICNSRSGLSPVIA